MDSPIKERIRLDWDLPLEPSWNQVVLRNKEMESFQAFMHELRKCRCEIEFDPGIVIDIDVELYQIGNTLSLFLVCVSDLFCFY